MGGFRLLLGLASISVLEGRKIHPSILFSFPLPLQLLLTSFPLGFSTSYLPPSNRNLVETLWVFLSFFKKNQCFSNHLVKRRKKKVKSYHLQPFVVLLQYKEYSTPLSLEGANNMTAFCSLVSFQVFPRYLVIWGLNLLGRDMLSRHAKIRRVQREGTDEKPGLPATICSGEGNKATDCS